MLQQRLTFWIKSKEKTVYVNNFSLDKEAQGEIFKEIKIISFQKCSVSILMQL